MPALARVTEVCEEVVAYLKANWGGTLPTIARAYMADFVVDEITGPRVYVMCANYGQAEVLTRASDINFYTVSIVFVDKYAESAQTIPAAWIDERVRLVESQIYAPLGDHRTEAVEGLWPETAAVTTVYDLDFLHQTRLFVSEIEIEFREVSEG